MEIKCPTCGKMFKTTKELQEHLPDHANKMKGPELGGKIELEEQVINPNAKTTEIAAPNLALKNLRKT